MLLTSLISVFFFLELIGLSNALFFLNGLLCLLTHVLSDLEPFPLLLLMSMAVLLRLDLEHLTIFRSVALFVLLNLLLSFEALLVQVHLESFLKMALLSQFIQSYFFL